jgi:hypothetical protein
VTEQYLGILELYHQPPSGQLEIMCNAVPDSQRANKLLRVWRIESPVLPMQLVNHGIPSMVYDVSIVGEWSVMNVTGFDPPAMDKSPTSIEDKRDLDHIMHSRAWSDITRQLNYSHGGKLNESLLKIRTSEVVTNAISMSTAIALFLLIALINKIHRDKWNCGNMCNQCGYSIGHHAILRCPECGELVDSVKTQD